MALVVATIVAAGFGPSYARSIAPPGLPFWVHLHGAAMALWLLLFAIQAMLVRQRAYRLHRTLGFASLGLVAIMAPLGVATNFLAIRRDAVPPFFTSQDMFGADVVDILLFVALYFWAIVWRRRSDWHKRLLLCATILLALPGIGRIGAVQSLGLDMIMPVSQGLLMVLALVGPLHDLLTRGRVHPAYLWGVAIIALAQPVHWMVAHSAVADAVVRQAEAGRR